MAIGGTISASCARSRVKNSRRARSGGADAGAAFCASHLRERSSRFANTDINDRQSRIAAIMSSCDLDLNVWPVTGSVGHRFGKLFPAVSFLGRAAAQCAVRTAGVVPCRERVKPALNAAGRRRHERQCAGPANCEGANIHDNG